MSTSRNYSLPTQKILWGTCGGVCAKCDASLYKDNGDKLVPIGEYAHIVGLEENSARYSTDLTVEEKNSFNNLILLCPSCHTEIDKMPVPEKYSVANLTALKNDHLRLIRERLGITITNLTFNELEVVSKYLFNASLGDDNLTLIPPKVKIQKNKLSNQVELYITQGLIQKKLIVDFLNSHPNIDFVRNLKSGFINEYNRLVKEGYFGDSLFYAMWEFAAQNRQDTNSRAAGLTVLTHLFELCDIFEK